MKVFTDLHHGDLYYSLHLLFEERLGWELYRPIGWDWFDQGFWKIGDPYPNPRDTAGQYLEITMRGVELFNNANGIPDRGDGTFYIHEPFHDYTQKAITLEQFKDMDIDLIIPSFPTHSEPYERLRNLYHPRARLLAQIGNIPQYTHLKYVLHSVPYRSKPGQRTLYYHQEIDSKFFYYQDPMVDEPVKKIYSFVNCLPYRDIYESYKRELSPIEMKSFGGGCPDGAVNGAKGVSAAMRQANMGWHLKFNNGMGHNTLGWYASGRPVIMRSQDFANYPLPDVKALMQHGVTCIDLDRAGINDNLNLIRECLAPERSLQMCCAAYQRFQEVVNYDIEAIAIKDFIEEAMS